ncbi:hypothetical protein A3J78_01045 [Candidatus Beckwithbacteria bacterium RBG_13_35_6]|uniref:Fido domain-containing protein n=1 Tax=Candidatus Beckwithbacteria bacterium RBG_13_35_6 TaxID=1797456 RepID=A0A1F5DDJ1_9BACT|nr:MAG: hypothetical protein A3J78_01045 [Candidatus Beckwithbacteria bacterium RBG_13_35_6]
MKNISTKPKGSTSYKETAFGIIPRSQLLKLELQGTQKGLDFIYNLVSKNKDININPKIICKLHKISFGWIFPDWAGKYRNAQVTISGKEAPPFYQLSELVINLCADLKERIKHLPNRTSNNFIIEVVKVVSWFQHRFVSIHPFLDYNGRTGRMLTVLLLLKLGLPPIEIKAENAIDRKRYITALQKADKGNFLSLENIISQALIENLNKF